GAFIVRGEVAVAGNSLLLAPDKLLVHRCADIRWQIRSPRGGGVITGACLIAVPEVIIKGGSHITRDCRDTRGGWVTRVAGLHGIAPGTRGARRPHRVCRVPVAVGGDDVI